MSLSMETPCTPDKRKYSVTMSPPPAPRKLIFKRQMLGERALVLSSNGSSRWVMLKSDREGDGLWNVRHDDLQRLLGGKYMVAIPANEFSKELPSNARLPESCKWTVYCREVEEDDEEEERKIPSNRYSPSFKGDVVLLLDNAITGCTIGISENTSRQIPEKFLPNTAAQ